MLFLYIGLGLFTFLSLVRFVRQWRASQNLENAQSMARTLERKQIPQEGEGEREWSEEDQYYSEVHHCDFLSYGWVDDPLVPGAMTLPRPRKPLPFPLALPCHHGQPDPEPMPPVPTEGGVECRPSAPTRIEAETVSAPRENPFFPLIRKMQEIP